MMRLQKNSTVKEETHKLCPLKDFCSVSACLLNKEEITKGGWAVHFSALFVALFPVWCDKIKAPHRLYLLVLLSSWLTLM